jgi:sulfate adenylyltransferase subunit 2
MNEYTLSHLNALESEGIHIMREVAAQFENPVLLFSGGKDSICMVRLAEKAFAPAKIPFPLMQIDTGHNFPEVLDFRDSLVERLGVKLVVASVGDCIAKGICEETPGEISRNRLQSPTLVHAIDEHKFDAAFGGGRRDEEKARAKERIFSFRDEFGGWDPKNQRPELWNLYNGNVSTGQNIRVFPISDWTELDVWQYILREEVEIPSIYFTHRREVFYRDDQWLPVCEFLTPKANEEVIEKDIRFRTVGDMVCTGGIESKAETLEEVIAEIAATRISERGGRADDKFSGNAMQLRKEQGYF